MSQFLDFWNKLFSNPYPSSDVNVEAGASLPVSEIKEEPNMTPVNWDNGTPVAADTTPVVADTTPQESLAEIEMPKSSVEQVLKRAPNQDITDTNEMLAKVLSSAKSAQKVGQVMGVISAAGNVFDDLINWRTQKSVADMSASNADLQAKVQIDALENRVMYTKSQLQSQFNKLVARTEVEMAAKNLKVSASSILEQNKDVAHDISVDFRTLESNAELQEIAIDNTRNQAKLMSSLSKKLQGANLVANLGKMATAVSGYYGGYDKLGKILTSNE